MWVCYASPPVSLLLLPPCAPMQASRLYHAAEARAGGGVPTAPPKQGAPSPKSSSASPPTAVGGRQGTGPKPLVAIGQCLARVVHVYVSLLLDTEGGTSPTRSAVWRAEQCLKVKRSLVFYLFVIESLSFTSQLHNRNRAVSISFDACQPATMILKCTQPLIPSSLSPLHSHHTHPFTSPL